LTASSEPVQAGEFNVITGDYFTISNASVEFWIKKHNINTIFRIFHSSKYINRFNIKELTDTKFSQIFGSSYSIEDNYVTRYYIIDTLENTNQMFDILKDISSNFTEYPIS
jgi:hypothetical protein